MNLRKPVRPSVCIRTISGVYHTRFPSWERGGNGLLPPFRRSLRENFQFTNKRNVGQDFKANLNSKYISDRNDHY